MTRLMRMAGHDDRMSVVDHLDELRSRLIVSLAALAIAFCLCLWQSHVLLGVINGPLSRQTQSQVEKGGGPLGQTWLAQQAVKRLAGETESVTKVLSAPSSGLSRQARHALASTVPSLEAAIARLPRKPTGDRPVTLGVGEPFGTTLTVATYFALLLALPVILFELYGFILPALEERERRAVVPLLWAVPVLFVCGVLFGYFVALPAAVQFLQNFNSGEFNVLVQASQYYEFAATMLIALGICFELPVAVLGAVRAGIVTPRALRRGRRYAAFGCVVIAAVLPGEVVTMALEAIPLYLLYEISVLVASLVQRRAAERALSGPAAAGGGA